MSSYPRSRRKAHERAILRHAREEKKAQAVDLKGGKKGSIEKSEQKFERGSRRSGSG